MAASKWESPYSSLSNESSKVIDGLNFAGDPLTSLLALWLFYCFQIRPRIQTSQQLAHARSQALCPWNQRQGVHISSNHLNI